MEHLEAFGFQELSNGDDAQVPAGVPASYPHSSSGSLLDPWTSLDTTGLSVHPSFQNSSSTTHFLEPSTDDAGLHPVNSFSGGYPPIPPFHTVMPELLKQTIRGAAFNSSDRNPPPRCHPGTRLTIVNRIQQFISNRNSGKRMFWIVASVGVGKSAIMQTLAENVSVATANEVVLGASIFFSFYGRSDGTKAIITLAYQLAASYTPYRDFIQAELIKDPTLLGKAMTIQFKRLIFEPFVRRSLNLRHGHFLIVIDGLDECERQDTQCELLGLISYFCITYPTSPLVWIIASRPEPHITSFFSRPSVTPAYEKEEIWVDSDEIREDVERFLRDELRNIKMKSFALRDLPQWPTEHDFLKLAGTSSGLFACASTIVKYIDDPAYNPASQLCEVLEVIDSNSRHHVEGKPHPMAHLDALYARILSRVPADVMADTRKLLLMMMCDPVSLNFTCNWLGMTRDTAYGATYHLRSVLHVPEPDEATFRELSAHHKSFTDYLRNFERSQFCPDVDDAYSELAASCARRVLEEAPNGVLKQDPGTYGGISLSWPSQEQSQSNDHMRFEVYRFSASQIVWGLNYKHSAFLNPFFIHTLTAFDEDVCFTRWVGSFDFPRCLFDDESRRSMFMEHNVLKQIQVRTLDPRNISKDSQVIYRFQCPAATMHQIPDPWDPPCYHDRYGSYEEGQDQDWDTLLDLDKPCTCSTRLLQHLEIGKTHSPDDLVTVFINFRLRGLVKYRFVDPGGSMAEWTYIIPYNFPSRTGMQSCSISGTSEQCDVCSN